MKKICVFCGANTNVPDHFIGEANQFGRMLAQNNFEIVYGGSKFGSMGALADGALDSKGRVIGVFPQDVTLINESIHQGVTEMKLVPDMHTRKLTMYNLSDAFVILPGGFGTMDETFEIITWKALKTHDAPIIIYNYRDYFKHWIRLVQHFVDTGFAAREVENSYKIASTKEEVIQLLKNNIKDK